MSNDIDDDLQVENIEDQSLGIPGYLGDFRDNSESKTERKTPRGIGPYVVGVKNLQNTRSQDASPTNGRPRPRSNITKASPKAASTPTVKKVDNELLDEVIDPDPLAVDAAFEDLLKTVAHEHVRQLNELRKQNTQLKLKLATVISSTWGLSDEGWVASPKKQGACDLQLRRKVENEAGVLHNVAVEEQHSAAAFGPQGSKLKTRPLWSTAGKEESVRKGMRVDEINHSNVMVAPEDQLDLRRSRSSISSAPADLVIISKYVMHPFGRTRLAWDMTSAMMIFWDLIMVPLGAFEPDDNVFTDFMDWVTMIFWTLDIAASFHTGFIQHGRIIFDRKHIAAHYLGSMFGIDASIVVLDWLATFLKYIGSDMGMNVGDILRLVRGFRIVRCFRVIKLKKLRTFFISLMDSVQSKLIFIIPLVMEFVFALLIMSHVLGSIWYLIGSVGKSLNARSWIQEEGIDEMSFGYRYFISFSWALHNFALSTSVIQPRNAGEGFYSAMVTLIGLCSFLFCISTITCTFLDMRGLQVESMREVWLLRRFLRQQNAPSGLKMRIMHCVEVEATKKLKMVDEHQVQLLNFVSVRLKSELEFNLAYSPLYQHPLLYRLEGRSQSLQGLTDTTLSTHVLSELDVVCTQELMAKDMIFVLKGSLFYAKKGGNYPENSERDLSANDWLCEAALWVSWACQGSAEAVDTSELIYLNVEAFGKVIEQEFSLWSFFSQYALHFVAHLNTIPRHELSDVYAGPGAVEKAQSLIDTVHNDHKMGVVQITEP